MVDNIKKGNPAQWVIEFISSAGNLILPLGGMLTITYPVGTTLVSTSISLTLANAGYWTATWDSSVSDYGQASWSVTAANLGTPAATGFLSIVD